VTETHDAVAAPAPGAQTPADLSGLKVAELQAVAARLGIPGAGRMRKADLLSAVLERSGGASAPRNGRSTTARAASTTGRGGSTGSANGADSPNGAGSANGADSPNGAGSANGADGTGKAPRARSTRRVTAPTTDVPATDGASPSSASASAPSAPAVDASAGAPRASAPSGGAGPADTDTSAPVGVLAEEPRRPRRRRATSPAGAPVAHNSSQPSADPVDAPSPHDAPTTDAGNGNATDRSGQDRSGQDRSTQDRSTQDRSGQDRSTQERGREDGGDGGARVVSRARRRAQRDAEAAVEEAVLKAEPILPDLPRLGGDRSQGDRYRVDRGERDERPGRDNRSLRGDRGPAGPGDRDDSDRDDSDRDDSDRDQSDHGQSDRDQADRGQSDRDQADRGQSDRDQADRGQSGRGRSDRNQTDRNQTDRSQTDRGQADRALNDGDRSDAGQADRYGNDRNQPDRNQDQTSGPREEFDEERGGRRRRGRNRQRDKQPSTTARPLGRERSPGGMDSEPEVRDDDVLVPVAGIVDILDSYAFVRTSGYLAGPHDVYVSLQQVKKYGLRKGDAVVGQVKQERPNEERRQKFNAIVRVDSVNGTSVEEARTREEFGKLVPLYPQSRLRLETEPNLLTTRIIDLVAPIGKGQRGLIVSPPKAGKTLVLQAIANAITTNNPECHLMVVLVDERPEEVTDMQRTVKGEVIASTFDRPAEDHTTVAELAIERAKRLVELGHDVVVLLDSITRLGRAYNLAAPASGRILSGGVDSSALYPPKRFFGAARNIENGGSLTILATALVETGSKMDEVIFEEFKGTGNMELRLSRHLADKRIYPAVDVNPSGTRREEVLLAPDELRIMWQLRRVLSALDATQAIELLLDRLKKSRSNAEFLMQVNKTAPGGNRDDA